MATSQSQREFMDLMRECGVPVTRENYIAMNWGEPLPAWTAELEMELPDELQDWSRFKTEAARMNRSQGSRVTKG